jgi:hypothetical protein
MTPASIRYKNPGAMWPGPIATKWGSRHFAVLNDGEGNKIAIFDTWVDGIAAQLDMWMTSPKYRNKHFKDAISVWAGNNNVPSYVAFLKSRVPGLTEKTILDDAFWRGPMAIPFLKAQSGHEAGRTIPASDQDWIDAHAKVFK